MIDKPILLDLPVPIRTNRLLIRPAQAGDGQQINDAVLESFGQFKLWLPWAKELPPTREESEIAAREMYADYILRKQLSCVVFKDNELIGMCGFVQFKWLIPSGEIGYWCRKNAQGRGYTQEAVNALVLYAFKQIGLRKVILRCDSENDASIKVAEKCGFKLEGSTFGDILKPLTQEMKTCLYYARFDVQGIDSTGVSWKT